MWKKVHITRLYILITMCVVSMIFVSIWFWNIHGHLDILKHPSNIIDSIMYLVTISSLQSSALSIYTYFAIDHHDEIYMFFYLWLTFESCILQLVAGYLSFQGTELFFSGNPVEMKLRYAIYQHDMGNMDPQYSLNITHVQLQFGCCGIWNYTDWMNTHWWQLQSQKDNPPEGRELVPRSCCTRKSLNNPLCNMGTKVPRAFPIYTNTINTNGCLPTVKKQFRIYLESAGSLTIVVSLVEMFFLCSVSRLCWHDIHSMVIDRSRNYLARCNVNILDDEHKHDKICNTKESTNYETQLI